MDIKNQLKNSWCWRGVVKYLKMMEIEILYQTDNLKDLSFMASLLQRQYVKIQQGKGNIIMTADADCSNVTNGL